MNRKAFTLIELLAVIVILVIILAIAVPSIIKVIDSVRINAYINNENIFVKATRTYIGVNEGLLPTSLGETSEVTLEALRNADYLSDIKDPDNQSINCAGYVLITKIGTNNYDYTPNLKCGEQSSISNSTNDGLLGYWKLNNNGIDFSANNNLGLLNGTNPGLNRFGISNKALTFNGTSDYIEINDSSLLSPDGSRTFLAWIKTGHNEDYHAHIFRIDTIDDYWLWLFIYRSGHSNHGQLGFGYRNSSTISVELHSTILINDNNWHLISAVLDYASNKIFLYVDGLLRSSEVMSIEYKSSKEGILTIGSSSLHTEFFPGLMDDIRIYNRALTATEISKMYELEKKRSK